MLTKSEAIDKYFLGKWVAQPYFFSQILNQDFWDIHEVKVQSKGELKILI